MITIQISIDPQRIYQNQPLSPKKKYPLLCLSTNMGIGPPLQLATTLIYYKYTRYNSFQVPSGGKSFSVPFLLLSLRISESNMKHTQKLIIDPTNLSTLQRHPKSPERNRPVSKLKENYVMANTIHIYLHTRLRNTYLWIKPFY